MRWYRDVSLLEFSGKVFWFLLTGAFGMGAWVTGIQLTLNTYSQRIEASEIKIEKMTQVNDDFQKRLIEFMGRIDERLKTIEHNQKR